MLLDFLKFWIFDKFYLEIYNLHSAQSVSDQQKLFLMCVVPLVKWPPEKNHPVQCCQKKKQQDKKIYKMWLLEKIFLKFFVFLFKTIYKFLILKEFIQSTHWTFCRVIYPRNTFCTKMKTFTRFSCSFLTTFSIILKKKSDFLA